MNNEYSFYSDKRVRKHVVHKYNLLLYRFGKVVDEYFDEDIEKYLKTRQMFATLLKAAFKGKGKNLTKEQSKQLAIYKEKFRKYGALQHNFLQLVIKIGKKTKRVPKDVILSMLRQTGFKFVSHGKHFKKNEHWSNFTMPKFYKAKELYSKYKKLEEDMTKEEKELLKKECDAGMHCMSYEQMLKFKEKQERHKEKRQMSIAKKAVEVTFEEFSKMKQENAELKAEIEHLKSLKDLNSDIPEEEDKDFVIEYEDLDKYFPDGIDQDDPKDQELMKHMSEHCWMRLDHEFEQERKTMENKSMPADEAEAQISACQRLLDSGELEDDDIPTEEEQLAQRKTTLSYRLQEFHDKGYLQASEAERLRQCCIYADELPKIKDKGISQSDTSHNLAARKRICKYICNHKFEFGLDAEKIDFVHSQLVKWLMTTEKCIVNAERGVA